MPFDTVDLSYNRLTVVLTQLPLMYSVVNVNLAWNQITSIGLNALIMTSAAIKNLDFSIAHQNHDCVERLIAK